MNRTYKDLLFAFGLLITAFSVRLFAFINTPVINHDGVLYINQAKAILDNNWKMAVECGYDFISLYHLMIPVFYKIFNDWITAAKSISLLFGTISVLPLFFLLRQFFSLRTAFLASLALAMNPFFVSYSVELVKDPVFWFFSLLGISLFVTSLKKDSRLYLLSLSSISFLIGGLARFEVLIYIIGSLIYIMFFEDRKFKKMLIFTGPVILLVVLLNIMNAYRLKETLHLWSFYFLPRAHRFFTDISDSLFRPEVLGKSVLSSGLLMYKMAKVIYVPFVPFFLAGFLSLRRDIGRDRHFRYLILLSVLSLVALFFFYMKIQVLSPRYTVFFILPAFIFICFGIEKIISLGARLGLKESYILPLFSLYIIVAVLASPSTLIPRASDKIVYKTAGEYIAGIEGNKNTIVMSPDSRIMFYANLHSTELECGYRLIKYKELLGMSYDDLVSALRKNKVRYFCWEAKEWKGAGYDFPKAARAQDFREMKQWEEGHLILYRVL